MQIGWLYSLVVVLSNYVQASDAIVGGILLTKPGIEVRSGLVKIDGLAAGLRSQAGFRSESVQ
jgi:hypothetical protein